jgi:hypothetical protein
VQQVNDSDRLSVLLNSVGELVTHNCSLEPCHTVIFSGYVRGGGGGGRGAVRMKGFDTIWKGVGGGEGGW